MNRTTLSGKEIRNKFISFFRDKHGHSHLKSSSLIPNNPTVLLTTAGMLQFVPVFLGYEKPPSPPRAVTVQKCARAGGKDSDIENVGRTPRHHTFFEMLGNFSFGDYFKKDIIPWSWDFVTNELQLDKDKLMITVYETDDESFEIWHKDVGIPEDRIIKMGEKDNFWGPPGPTGPCGPCTEIHYDMGEEYGEDRLVEIWNLVFMELNKDDEGNLTPLEKKNVDTGMGLERVTMVVNGLNSTFDTDLLKPILDKVCELSGKIYKSDDKTDVSLRIITDHARCVTFLISDGLIPGNEGRNYVLRMIMRRALRHGKMLGIELPFLYKLVDTIVNNYYETYPELQNNKDKIISVIKREEERFSHTLGRGEALLDDLLSSAETKIISGDDAFKLYDTFGFPLELTIEMAAEKGFEVDIDGFNRAMAKQKERAREAHTTVRLTDDAVYGEILERVGSTQFIGYEQTRVMGSVIKHIIQKDDIAEIILDITPFYAESGGQVGDTGIIEGTDFKAEVLDTKKINDLIIHKTRIISGEPSVEQVVNARVDEKRRRQIVVHHTSAHLLQSALRKILGEGVAQAGSQVESDRTRFDFTFDRALTPDEIEKIENLINSWIEQDYDSQIIETTPDEAKAMGALALFGEKYGDTVRVISIDEISRELCGGTHARSTGEIRLCKIVSESAIAAGTRRIELVCAQAALEYLNQHQKTLEESAKKLKIPAKELPVRIDRLQEELSRQQKRISALEAEIAKAKTVSLHEQAQEISGGKLLVTRIDGISSKALKETVEKIADKLGNSIVVLASVTDGKISILAKISDNFVQNGVNAGQLVNEIAQKCGGKGGGRPNFAQAGADDVTGLDPALENTKKWAARLP